MDNEDIIPALIAICLFILELKTQQALKIARKCKNSHELKMHIRNLHKADEKFRQEAIYILEMSKLTFWN